MKKKKGMYKKVTAVMLSGFMVAPTVITITPSAIHAEEAETYHKQSEGNTSAVKANEDKDYSTIINGSHQTWIKDQYIVGNDPEIAEVMSESEDCLKLSVAGVAGLDNASKRGSFYSKQATDKIKNGSIEADIIPTTDAIESNKFGFQIRCVNDTDLTWIAYDSVAPGGWYIQRKAMSKGGKNQTPAGRTRKDLMPVAGESLHVKITFEEELINVWINGEQIFKDVSVADPAAPITAGKIGFMLSGGVPDMYVKNIKMTDTINSDTFNGEYDWSKDEFLPYAENRGKVAIENKNAKNWFELKASDKNNSVATQATVMKQTAFPIKDGKYEAYVTPAQAADKSGFVLAYRFKDLNNAAWFGYDAQGWYWQTRHNGSGKYYTGKRVAGPDAGQTVHIETEVIGGKLLAKVDGEVIFDHLEVGDLGSLGAGSVGFMARKGSFQIHDFIANSYDIDIPDETPEIEENLIELTTSQMKVKVDQAFPRVAAYEFLDQTSDHVMLAQPKIISRVNINKESILPTVSSKVEGSKITYQMNVVNAANTLDADITAVLEAKDNIVSFEITEVKNNKGTVNTLDIPGMVLASVSNNDENGELVGANMSTTTTRKGDTYVTIDKKFNNHSAAYKEYGFLYGFVSNKNFSAGLWSNSTNTKDQRVTASPFVTKINEENTAYIGLRSSEWTIENAEYGVQEKDLPKAKVIITRDNNGTGTVDWQDGAIAYREIMNNPMGSENIPNEVAQRVVENFASQAAHPFLETLDGVKRVNLATDNLGQRILLKGFASEGHDSAHPDYGDIGKRIGGAEEMKALLDKGEAYGAVFGVHINASEAYPEAKGFHENLVDVNNFGWNWLDEAYPMNAMYDLKSGERQKRLESLSQALGDSKLGFIYLDVWGADSWPTRKISDQFKELGWACSNEWGYANEYDSIWNHWAVDLSYGGSDLKGINSDVARFIRNHQKDSWVGNWPAYGGTADHPLLGGEDVTGFEGWQREKDFADYMNTTYAVNIPTKFLQHYQVMEWINEETIDPAKQNAEKYIRLENTIEGKTEKVEVERVDFTSKARTFAYNGTKVLDGDTYLLPWFWDESGNRSENKLYHYNKNGGTTTWNLIDEWKQYANVNVYELSDQGKKLIKNVSVENGKVTLDAQASTAYVIYPGDVVKTNPSFEEMKWGEGTHLIDPNFSSLSLHAWKVTGNSDNAASIVHKKDNFNPVLRVMDNKETVELTQTITDLEAGKTYMALAAVENKSDRKAYIEVETSDGTCISNYTERSIVKNYIGVNAHNTENTDSYMQNMPVVFTVPKGADTAVLKLRVEKGSGTVLFDELRVVETLAQNQTSETVFEQDFEQVVQGLYPFVVSNHQGRPTDVKVHLSEKNAPYTQKGWNDRIIDDVLNGDWSIKVHQLTNLKGVVLQTIPQTYRFEPGQKYKISFNYEAGADDSYALIVSNKENVRGVIDADHEQLTTLKYADEPTKVSFELTGHENGQTWFGIYSNASNINEGTAGKKPWKLGKADIVIDDIRIEKVVEDEAVDKSELQALLDEHKDKQQGSYTDASWNVFETALAAAEAVWNDDKATKNEVTSAVEALQKAVDGLRKDEAVDKTKLQEAYDAYQEVKQEGYTKTSWDSLQEKLKEAKIVLEDKTATQEAVDKATQALIDAVSALEKEVVTDTEALKLTLKAASALEQSLYTSESWETLQKAITDAQEVLHDQSATQEQIDEVKGKLEKAIASLEKKETPVDPEEPIKPVDPVDPVEPDQPVDTDQPVEPEQPIEETMISNGSNTIFVIGKLDKAIQLITKEYSSDEIETMLKTLQDKELWKKSEIEKVFDIYLLKDGVVVQPDGTITVRIKVDAELLAKELKIFYLDQDGKAKEMKTRKGSEYIEFDIDHLSTYAIASQKKEISNGADTGDHSNTGMILMLLFISGSAIIMLSKKKEA